MIEEITIKFGTELKPTQYSWKSQLYSPKIGNQVSEVWSRCLWHIIFWSQENHIFPSI